MKHSKTENPISNFLQCNEAFSKSEDLLGEGFAGTNVIAIRLEALGDPNEGSEDESLLRRKRQSSSDLDSESAEPESTESYDLGFNYDLESGNTKEESLSRRKRQRRL